MIYPDRLDPYPWMREVRVVSLKNLDEIKKGINVLRIGRKLSPTELKKFKESYLGDVARCLKDYMESMYPAG